ETSPLADHPAGGNPAEGADEDRRGAEARAEAPDRLERGPRRRADEDAEDTAADCATDSDRVCLTQQLVCEALDDLGVVAGRGRHLLVIGGTPLDLENNRGRI